MKESLAIYLETKRVHRFRGKAFYKLKGYKSNFYVEKETIERLSDGPREVTLEKNALLNTAKGMIKWDEFQKKILVSESKIRIMYQPFTVE